MWSALRFNLLAAVLLATVAGCRVEEHEYPPSGVIVDRGYYYDVDYYDGFGHYHPREYWYYDGHQYFRRDGVPHGFEPHARFYGPPRGGPGFHGGGPGPHGPGGDVHGSAGGDFHGR